MSELTRGIGRLLTRLLEAYAPTYGSTMIVHQTFYGCHVVELPDPTPPLDPHDDDRHRQPPRELGWLERDGQWRLDGQILPAVPTVGPGSGENSSRPPVTRDAIPRSTIRAGHVDSTSTSVPYRRTSGGESP